MTVNRCQRCGAQSEQQAETMCRPGVDECPMTCSDEWDAALAELSAQLDATLPPFCAPG